MPTCPNDIDHGEMIDNENNTRTCGSCGYTESHENPDTFRSWS